MVVRFRDRHLHLLGQFLLSVPAFFNNGMDCGRHYHKYESTVVPERADLEPAGMACFHGAGTALPIQIG